MQNRKLPPGWAYDPFAEFEILDVCHECGADIDDDTEVFFRGTYGKPDEVEFIGCEECVISMSAREALDKGYGHFDEFRCDPATGMKERVNDDD